MIELEKLLSKCDFHIRRGEDMTIDPVELKQALQTEPDVRELIDALTILSRWVDQNCDNPACTLPLKQATEALAKHGGAK